MAHELKRDELRLHQTLHGYADGHRLLADSTSLKGREAKTMLTLSDASGSTSRIDDGGYLTGYPLPEAGLYALAKTWPAPEMPRPGCVWTHTLLIDFADLANISSPSVIVRAFRRPASAASSFADYEREVVLPAPPVFAPPSVRPGPSILRRLLWALYAQPEARVFSGEGTVEVRERLVLMLWSQQWPRLRRSFRFCTLVFSDRSSDGVAFDLQFVPQQDRFVRSRFSKLLDADRDLPSDLPEWIEDAVVDLLDDGPRGSLRMFLRSLGADVVGGREAFEPLCRLHRFVHLSSVNPAEAIALLQGPLASATARDIKAEVVARVARMAEAADDSQLDFALKHYALVPDSERAGLAARLGEALWVKAPHLAASALDDGDAMRREIASQGLSSIAAGRLLEALRASPVQISIVLRHRVDLLAMREVWAADGPFVKEALGVALQGPLTAEVLNAMLEASNQSLVGSVASHVRPEILLGALVARLDGRRDYHLEASEVAWLVAAAQPNAIASVFSKGQIRERATIASIIQQCSPDVVPNEFGEDPCWTAFRGAQEHLPDRSQLYLRTWLLARGLGFRSRNQAELIAAGLEEVYPATLAARLPDECWQLLDSRLPNSYFWGQWDRGRRLRAAVANAFVGRDLSPFVFGKLLRDDDQFADLASEASTVPWGRGYLRRVKRQLKDRDPLGSITRVALLKRLL